MRHPPNQVPDANLAPERPAAAGKPGAWPPAALSNEGSSLRNRLRNPTQWGRPYTFSTPPPERLNAETPATEEASEELPSVETVIALEVKQEDAPDEAGTPSSAP